jgi:hypothetical protein
MTGPLQARTVLPALALVLAGCGSSGNDKTSDIPSAAPPKPTTVRPVPRPPKGTLAAVKRCATAAGLTVEQPEPRLVRVIKEGEGLATVKRFGSTRAARAFADQLVVPGTQGGRLVAVYRGAGQGSELKTRLDTCILTGGR